jgi:hypothetical protein
MRRRLVAFLAGFALLVGLAPASVLATGGRGGLEPGETVTYRQKVPVNIVFLGYPRSMIDRSDLLDELPSEYEPVVRYPQFYGLEGRDMGLEFTFDYDIDFAGQRTTNRFFRFLKRIGEPGDPTDFQLLYNDQVNNVQDVTGPVLHIDAPTVERWLARNLHTPDKGYTIVYINWHSRPDSASRTRIPATTSATFARAGRSSPGAERTAACGSTTCRPARRRGPTTGTSTIPTSTATVPRSTACRRSGSTPPAASAVLTS